MSIGDIRIATGLLRHPKFKKLAKRLGVEALHWLIALWFFAAEYRQSGVLTDMTAEDIELAVEWTGASGEFVDTLKELRWLDEDDDGVLSLHSWAKWQPWIVGAPDRSEAARRAAEARWNGNSPGARGEACNRDASGMGTAEKGNAPSPSSPPEPSHAPSPPSPPTQSDTAFVRFFKAYPRQAGRARALLAWQTLGPSAELFERIMADSKVRFEGIEETYITKPANYLIGREWEDEIVARDGNPKGSKKSEKTIDIAKRRLKKAHAEEGNDHD